MVLRLRNIDEHDVLAMQEQFVIFLQEISRNAARTISNIALLRKEQQRQILEEWNTTQVDYPRNQCVHQLIEAQARRTPESVALVLKSR